MGLASTLANRHGKLGDMAAKALVQQWERHTEWPLVTVAVVFLAAYSINVLTQPDGTVSRVITVVTVGTWILFAVDYAARLWLAADRRTWFIRHLLDLTVVVLPHLRPLHLVRLVVLVTALQKSTGNAIRGRVLLYTVATTGLFVYVGSLAVLQAERSDPQATITSFGKALWWAMSTITTVGYGAEYPVTVTGRLVAVPLMIGGITLLGVVTATIASWIVQTVSADDELVLTATAAQINELHDEIRALRTQLDERTDTPTPLGPGG